MNLSVVWCTTDWKENQFSLSQIAPYDGAENKNHTNIPSDLQNSKTTKSYNVEMSVLVFELRFTANILEVSQKQEQEQDKIQKIENIPPRDSIHRPTKRVWLSTSHHPLEPQAETCNCSSFMKTQFHWLSTAWHSSSKMSSSDNFFVSFFLSLFGRLVGQSSLLSKMSSSTQNLR
jgi:hypothetical protein